MEQGILETYSSTLANVISSPGTVKHCIKCFSLSNNNNNNNWNLYSAFSIHKCSKALHIVIV